MSSDGSLNPESDSFESRPPIYIGQHDTGRKDTLTNGQYRKVISSGFDFATTPITNEHFRQRVVDLYKSHIEEVKQWSQERGFTPSQLANQSLPLPAVPTLTDEDTSYFPSNYVDRVPAYSSPWIDLCSSDPVIAHISRQVLNIEAAYASFCGARTIIIPGPRQDDGGAGVAQYARAIQEVLTVASHVNIVIHMPMYREPGLEEKAGTLSSLANGGKGTEADPSQEIDLFSAWDSWHTIRTVNSYAPRLFVAIRLPRRMPDKDLQERWFAEPLSYLTIDQGVFQTNRAGHPSLGRYHQEMINSYMRLKNAPWLILTDCGPSAESLAEPAEPVDQKDKDFPTLAESTQARKENHRPHTLALNVYIGYMRYLERQQPPYSAVLETQSLVQFQDYLQSPLQPLADNLESATYEVFEGDPVKYDQYQAAITEAMAEWKILKKPTSDVASENHPGTDLIVAVAGAGRGPLVTRVLRAAAATNTSIQLWALEKNQNAYVYLLRQNKLVWNNQVTVVKTDMRAWNGPVPKHSPNSPPTKLDILVTELLGSFGDNELSPECLDGIQRHIATPHGISIPHNYTAVLSPIATPRIFADLSHRSATGDENAFETPWVTRLYQINYLSQKGVPGKPRFQDAWEFAHPVPLLREDEFIEKNGKNVKYQTGAGGAITGSAGTNEHNARQCHLTFVCPRKGVCHGLGGYFTSVLYASQVEGSGKAPVEISIVPDQIDRKSKDMISWFPIFFPLKKPLYFPQDTELEVTMWRQTDDTKVWYEWIVEAFAWVGPKTRIKVGASELHSSRKVACLM